MHILSILIVMKNIIKFKTFYKKNKFITIIIKLDNLYIIFLIWVTIIKELTIFI